MSVEIGAGPDGQPYVKLSDPIDEADVRQARESGVPKFWISAAEAGNDLSFLPLFADQIEDLNIQAAWKVRTVKPLQWLFGLRELYCGRVPKFDADLARLPLERVHLHWSPGADSVFECRGLEHLQISYFPDEDLQRVAPLRKLRELRVGLSQRLQSLEGVEELPELRFLEVYCSHALRDIAPLTRTPVLERLMIDRCRQIGDLATLAKIPNLSWLTLVGCADLPSLSPLKNHASLERFFMSRTKVLDGDMTPLLSVPNLWDVHYQRYRHYSHRYQEIFDLLEAKARGEMPPVAASQKKIN